MRPGRYILDDQWRPIPCPDLMKWGMWMQGAVRTVALDSWNDGELRVSTVFLGLDHNYEPEGPPVLWETMIFSKHHPDVDCYQCRCSGTMEQAEAMHMEVLAHLRNTINIDECTEATHRSRSGIYPRLDEP